MHESPGADTQQPHPWEYHLQHRVVIEHETWEFWQGFREIIKVRCGCGSNSIDFPGERLGWGWGQKLYSRIRIPAQVEMGQCILDQTEVEAMAARIHLALCAMKERNIVVLQQARPALPEPDRVQILRDFKFWMEERGYRIEMDNSGERILIKRKGFNLFRPQPTESEIVERASRVAHAFHALHHKEVDHTVLYVSEGASCSSWLAEVDWQ